MRPSHSAHQLEFPQHSVDWKIARVPHFSRSLREVGLLIFLPAATLGGRGIPQALVTSNLDPEIQRADHRQGGGGATKKRDRAPKSFIVKILTSNSLQLKVLQSIFANPAPVKPFRGRGDGGYPWNVDLFQIETGRRRLVTRPHPNNLCERFPQPQTLEESFRQDKSRSRKKRPFLWQIPDG